MEIFNTGQRYHEDAVAIPFRLLPSGRVTIATKKGIERKLLLVTWGGIGDQICSEPTLRYALKVFKDCEITLASYIPDAFSHLKFHDVYDLNRERPIYDDYLVFKTIAPLDELVWQFANHMVVNCVDFPAICAFRCQLPVRDRVVTFYPPTPVNETLFQIVEEKHKYVIVHAGRHWQSKTFPTDWWNAALESIKYAGFIPVLIGKEGTNKEDNQGTVQTETEGCLDLRGKTSLNDSIWLLQKSAVVICNDSSPLHMAVTGRAWIGCIATVKHPDYIFHWRSPGEGEEPVWKWRTENLGVGGMWDIVHHCPNSQQEIDVEAVDEAVLRSWLPDPKTIGFWCREKMNDYFRSV